MASNYARPRSRANQNTLLDTVLPERAGHSDSQPAQRRNYCPVVFPIARRAWTVPTAPNRQSACHPPYLAHCHHPHGISDPAFRPWQASSRSVMPLQARDAHTAAVLDAGSYPSGAWAAAPYWGALRAAGVQIGPGPGAAAILVRFVSTRVAWRPWPASRSLWNLLIRGDRPPGG